jgi:ABC-type sugar transport system ATPase subunit
MGTVVLETKDIVKTFPGIRALNAVDFDLSEGEVHALCGENGAGKSTLMHILAGVYRPDSGEIHVGGQKVDIGDQHTAQGLGIGIVYQERSLVNGLSVAENIFAARQPVGMFNIIKWKDLYKLSSDLLESLAIHIDPTTMVGSLSPALQQMVEIAKALSLNPRVLILDEPTATITEHEVDALFSLIKKLQADGMAIIYISHRLAEIFRVADRVTVLKDGRKVETADVPAVDYDWLINRMVGRDLDFARIDRTVKKDRVLEVKGFNSGKFKNINFFLNRGEILTFAGLAGAGRSELMRAIFGADKRISGKVFIENREVNTKATYKTIKQGIGYLPEDRKAQGLFLDMSIEKNIVSSNLKKVSWGALLNDKKSAVIAKEYKERLNIMTPSTRQRVVNLSGGNQQKVVFAKWLFVNPKILIVDEPTRGVDVGAKSEIYGIMRKLTEQGVSIIMVSSDLPEVLSISDRIYIMHNGGITGELEGRKATEEAIMKHASGITDGEKLTW